MTWFRVEAALRDHKVIGVIAEHLRVRPAEAAGLYILTLAGFAEHERSGRPEMVTDTDLEGWARWQGRRGRYAQLFRTRFIEQREGEKDPVGQIKGWWRQSALFREQERGRGRGNQQADSRESTGQLPEHSRENGAGLSRDNPAHVDEDVDGNGIPTTPSSLRADADVSPIQYTIRCTAAANRGLRENPLIGGFNELVSSAQDEPGLWRAAGIPLAVAERAILHRAKSYRVRGSRKQPTTLGYFRQAVEEEWQRAQSRVAEGEIPNVPDVIAEAQLDEYEQAARRLAEEDKAHAG